MQTVKLENAIGLTLAHDITEIRPGEFKGPAFHRGHVVKHNDIEHLKRLGKEHLYILDNNSDQMHEDEAVRVIAEALCGEGVCWEGPPREGKLKLYADREGILKVDIERLSAFNELGLVMCATRHTNSLVKQSEIVGATRAIPLMIAKSVVMGAVKVAKQAAGVLKVLPLKRVKAGVLITGNEVYYGRIKDRFVPVIRKKVEALGGSIIDVLFLPDDDDRIADAALNLVEQQVDVIITTGGMSVDPDDRTRFALQKAGATEMIYGSAVLPGAMFMIAKLKDIPVLGIPACGLHAEVTIFDLIYPRILAGETFTRKEISRLGHGGICLECKPCRFPQCPFGKSG